MAQKIEPNEQRFYWSETNETIEAWTGGHGFYKRIMSFKFFGFMFVLWKLPRFDHLNKEKEDPQQK